MAKFLPFVVKKSTPEHIYQALISRSKGMNSLLIASILHLVVEKGIVTVRATAAGLPDMELSKLYEQLINAYPSYRITNEQFEKIQSVGKYINYHKKGNISDGLCEYEEKDIMSFLLVMLLIGKLEEYTSFKLEKLFDGTSRKSELNLIENGLFSNSGSSFLFSSKEELAAYVWFYSGIFTVPSSFIKPVKAIYSPESKSSPASVTEFVKDPKETPPEQIPPVQRGSNKIPETPEPDDAYKPPWEDEE